MGQGEPGELAAYLLEIAVAQKTGKHYHSQEDQRQQSLGGHRLLSQRSRTNGQVLFSLIGDVPARCVFREQEGWARLALAAILLVLVNPVIG